MKRRLAFALSAITLLLSLMIFLTPGHALAYDANDPYDSGCINGAKVANSASITTGPNGTGTYLAKVENWYSPGCVTNWTRIVWSLGTALQTQIASTNSVTHDHQCYPTNCSTLYTGGASPSWTDMVDGHDVVCAAAWVRYQGKDYTTPCINA